MSTDSEGRYYEANQVIALDKLRHALVEREMTDHEVAVIALNKLESMRDLLMECGLFIGRQGRTDSGTQLFDRVNSILAELG